MIADAGVVMDSGGAADAGVVADGGGDASASPDAFTDAGNSGVDSGGIGSDAAPPPGGRGEIVVTQFATTADLRRASHTLAVRMTSFAKAGALCTQATDGPCAFLGCDADSSTVAEEHAGPIAVVAAQTNLRADPNASTGLYATVADSGRLWNANENVTATSTGAAVPALSLQTVSPALLTVTQPAFLGPRSRIQVDRSVDLSVAWSTGGGGMGDPVAVLARSVTGPTGTRRESLVCRFARGAGSGTIPSQALLRLTAGAGTLSIFSGRSASQTVGPWEVQLEARSIGNTAVGVTTSLPADYQ